MKRCNACDEEFEDKFSFCPVDGTPLNKLAAALTAQNSRREFVAFAVGHEPATGKRFAVKRPEFNVTMIDNAVLLQRLKTELRFLALELKRA